MHYLVHNSSAGRGRMPDALAQVRAFFDRHALALTVLPPAEGTALTALLQALPADARILSLGGDGTLNGVLPATVGTARTVGILPAGSADDFATALGLPRDSLLPALEAVRSGHTRLVDTAAAMLTMADGSRLESRFVNALGTGFDAEVASVRETRFDWLSGAAGYYTALGLGWLRMRRATVAVAAAGTAVFSGRALLVSVQNSMRTGGSFHFVPGAVIDDGLLNIVVAADIGRLRILKLLPLVTKPEPWDDERVHRFSRDKFSIGWDSPRTVHLDGEIKPPAEQVEVQVLPRSLRVFAPRPS